MRWTNLFADLEAQVGGLVAAELDGEIAERIRIDAGRLTLVSRLGGAVGHPVEVRCAGAGSYRGRLDRVGVDWLLVTDPGGAELLVPVASLLAITGLGRRSVAPGVGRVELGLRSALRGIARDRSPVRAALVDGTSISGTVDRVGVDHLELAEHPLGEPRRPGAVTAVRAIPFPALAVLVRR